MSRIEGQQVRNLREVQGVLSSHEPGNEVEVTFIREGESMTRKIKLARLADVLPEQE